MDWVRSSAIVLACLFVGQAPQTPKFRATTNLILIDVSVTDQDGRPVPGLKEDDFRVQLDGQVRPVRAVAYEELPAESPTAAAAPGNAGQSRSATNVLGPSVPRRVVVMFIDDLSLSPSRGKSMLGAAARFVHGLPGTDLVGLATSSGSVRPINPTPDHGAVETALPRVVGESTDPRQLPGPPVGIEEALAIQDGDDFALRNAVMRDCFNGAPPPRGEDLLTGACADDVGRKARQVGDVTKATTVRQLAAYESVITAMRGAPGLKELVVISDGVALSSRADRSAIQLEPIERVAATSGVELHVLTEEPAGVDLAETDQTRGGPPVQGSTGAVAAAELRRSDDRWVRDKLETLADVTGGTFRRVIGLGDTAFAEVVLASSARYQIGVEAPSDAKPGRDYRLSVRVARDGVKVRANQHAFAPTPDAPVPVDAQLRQAIGTGQPMYGVPVAVGTALRRGDDAAHVTVDTSIEIPGSVAGPVTVVFGLGNRTGLVKSGRTTIAAPAADGTYRASISLPVAAGSYRFRVAAADADEHVGSVEVAVEAQLKKIGPFLASDLLTGWTAGTGAPQLLALERVPVTATQLVGVIELYPTAAGQRTEGLHVRMAIVGGDGKSLQEQTLTPASANGMLRATGAFPLAGLAPGPYVLQATIVDGETALGTVTTSVRISR